MKNKLIFFFTICKNGRFYISSYKKKFFKILIYEIYFSIKYFRSGNFIKFRNSDRKTDTLPCPYYFIHKISQFVNKRKITNIVDLGSGFGRITNFLSDTTEAAISGYEDDKEVCDVSITNRNSDVIIENKDVLNINYKNLTTECFIINDLFYHVVDLEFLKKKIEAGMNNLNKKYYLIIINTDEKKINIFNYYKLLKFTIAGKSRHVRFLALNN